MVETFFIFRDALKFLNLIIFFILSVNKIKNSRKAAKNKAQETGLKSQNYFFSIMYIKLENSPVFIALKLEIAPNIIPRIQKRGDFLYFSLNIEM